MRNLFNAAALLVVFAASSPSLFAQWPSYPTAGVPRTPAGQPDLGAPAPRTADGKPDLSGLWENTWMIAFRKEKPFPSPTTGGPPVATFSNVGAGFHDGQLPLTPWAADLLKKRKD